MFRLNNIIYILWVQICLIWFIVTISNGPCFSADNFSVKLDIPLMDLPLSGSQKLVFPSMDQSLNWSKSYYHWGHYKIQESFSFKYTFGETATLVGFDVLSMWMPLGNAWLHEEWHRAVLGRHGINSYNEIYDFNIFSEVIAVSRVDDLDLINLKKEHPADQVRLSAAGIEAQYEMNLAFEKDQFFFNTRTQDLGLLWLNVFNNIYYIYTCTTDEADSLTKEIIGKEGSNIHDRDFTGLDLTAWVYDLFRPEDAYEKRGVHPSGNGIDRYIQNKDLTSSEKKYLERQFYLSLLNLLDPFLLEKFYYVHISPLNGRPFKYNLLLRHHLTSFGYAIQTNLFYQQNKTNLLINLAMYHNQQIWLPGIDIELSRYPLTLAGNRLSSTCRLSTWMQPEDQKFRTSRSKLGGMATINLAWPLSKSWETFLTASCKTAGWVAGTEALNEDIRVGFGFSYTLSHLTKRRAIGQQDKKRKSN